MTTVWYLTLVIGFVGGYQGGAGATTVPQPFESLAECKAAAKSTEDTYTGSTSDFFNHACTPVQK